MCLAIYKPAKKIIPESHLREGFRSNPHGAGLAFAEKGVLEIRKGYFHIDRFMEDYDAFCHLPMLVHFRLATHGRQNSDNCHPFPMLDNKSAVIHNGIINIKSTEELSDTGHFVLQVLEPLAKHMPITDPAAKYLVEQAVGTYNKIVVLNADGTHVIFNEDSGHWNEGVWYSNKGYEVSEYAGWERMEDDYMSTAFPSRTPKPFTPGDRASNERENIIKKIMRLEKCSRLDAEWMEESGWPWDYDVNDAIHEV